MKVIKYINVKILGESFISNVDKEYNELFVKKKQG